MNHLYGCFRKKSHRQVPHAVDNSFIAEVWNNTETGIIVCGLLKCVIARSKCFYFSHCLSFHTLQSNHRNVQPKYSQTSTIASDLTIVYCRINAIVSICWV